MFAGLRSRDHAPVVERRKSEVKLPSQFDPFLLR
jgi:hypothetical protein